MYYKTGMPRVVGEFDAENLHSRIDNIATTNGVDRTWDIQTKLAGEMGMPYAPMSDIARIHWKRLFRPIGFGSVTTDGDIDELLEITSSQGSIDSWHADDTSGNVFTLPEILTTASRYPTLFLVGRIALPKNVFRDYQYFTMDFWESDEAKSRISTAIERGDAEPVSFKPGEVLKVPAGTIHKRNLPRGASGYRYFMRLFPKVHLTHAGTVAGRMRPF